MNEAHKGHRILVSASRLATARQWKLYLTVIWNEDGKGIVSKLTVNRTFRLREEAEMDGLLFAKEMDRWWKTGSVTDPGLGTLIAGDDSNECAGAGGERGHFGYRRFG